MTIHLMIEESGPLTEDPCEVTRRGSRLDTALEGPVFTRCDAIRWRENDRRITCPSRGR